MRELRRNTGVIVTVGPFLDKTDGVTLEPALTITNERITLVSATYDGAAPTLVLDNITGATSGTSNDLNYITGNDAAMMQMELSAANVNRYGSLLLTITDAAHHAPVWHEYQIVNERYFDAKYGSGLIKLEAESLVSRPSYIGDFTLGTVAEMLFWTNGTLGGSPTIAVYAGNNTSEITGAQLTVDHDGKTGLNHVSVTASTGNGYQVGTNYSFVISAGTVGSKSVLGYVVGHFSIDNRSAGIIDAASLSSAAVAKIWAQVIDTYTALEVMRGMGASLGGEASGLSTTTAVYRAIDDSKPRITATVDASGNRSAVTLDLTP